MAKPTPGSTYTVQPNDNLYDIAKAAYNDPNKWPLIWNDPQNRSKIGNTPGTIQIGWKLFIPPLPSASPQPTSTSPKPGSIYTVQPNDTLSAIAKAAYNDPNKWPLISGHPLNKELSSNPNQIQIGWVIYIPPLS